MTAMVGQCCLQSQELEKLYEQSRVFVVAVYSAVFVLALPANGLTAWLALLAAWRGNVLAVYLFCLALCELLYVATLPLWVVYIQSHHNWTLPRYTCRLTAFVFFCNVYSSILLLCCLACDRALALARPLSSRRSPRTAALVCTATLLLVGAVHIRVLLLDDSRNSNSNICNSSHICNSSNSSNSSYSNTCFDTLPLNSVTAKFYYVRFTLGFALPLGVLVTATHSIRRSIQRSTGLSVAHKIRAQRLATAVLLVFLSCFGPYHAVLLLRAATFSYYGDCSSELCCFEKSIYSVFSAFLCLCTVNSVADPILYVLASSHLRQEASRFCGCAGVGGPRTELAWLTGSKELGEPRSPGEPPHSCMTPKLEPPCTPGHLQGEPS